MSDSSEDPELTAMRTPGVPQTLDYVGLAAGLLPFVLSFKTTRSQSVTVTTTDAAGKTSTTGSEVTKFFDPVALAGALIAICAGMVLLAQTRKVMPDKRVMRAVFGLGITALGVFQLIVRSGLTS